MIKTGCIRGGGVLIAVRRKLCSYNVDLANNDSLIDQLCICISGPSSKGSLYLVVSYIPPNSNNELYCAHANNISSLVTNKLGDNHLCVLGDFNLCNVSWSGSFSNFGLTPMNVTAYHESYLLDNILSLNLMQINNF